MSSWIGITGAAQGLGKEMAMIYLNRGLTVIGLDINLEGLQKIEAEYPGKFISKQIDLSKNVAESCIEDIYQEYGAPSIWINNAGMATIARFEKSYLNFKKVMQVNFQSMVDLTHFWLQVMETEGRGILVNVASVAGHVAAPFFTSYSASKFAVVGFTQALQEELKLKKSPINLLLLSPGFVDTSIMQGQDLELPKFLNFIRPGPQDCALEMVDAIDKKNPFYLPTVNGKIMYQIGRIGGPLKKMTLQLITKNIPNNIWDK